LSKTLYVDNDMLENYIDNSGLKVGYLCETLGISRQAFDKKRKGVTPFKAVEVFALCVLLNIKPEDKGIIFCPKG